MVSAELGGDRVVELLAREGFVAAKEEAAELRTAARDDQSRLEELLRRRLSGEPLAWITGSVEFCGLMLQIDPGVYVPRWQSEPLARRAAALLSEGGIAIDLCTGSGAIATHLASRRRGARVVASDIDPRAVVCARANGVEAYVGDLFEPLPVTPLLGRTDVVVGVVPYVPHTELHLLPRDTLSFEARQSYDGGDGGLEMLVRVVRECPRFLCCGGALLLELGGDQGAALGDELHRAGFVAVELLTDEDGDVRGVVATYEGDGASS